MYDSLTNIAADVIFAKPVSGPRPITAEDAYWLELGDGNIARFYRPTIDINFMGYAALKANPAYKKAEAMFWQNPHDTSPSSFISRVDLIKSFVSSPSIPYNIHSVPKIELRTALSKYMLSTKPLPAIVVSFHHNDSTQGDHFATSLKNMFTFTRKKHVVVNSSTIHYAITRDKVLFWLFCCHKGLNHPLTDIIKLQTWNEAAPGPLKKIAGFIAALKSDYVVIKPTNASTNFGVVVVKKSNLKAMLSCIVQAKKTKDGATFLTKIIELNGSVDISSAHEMAIARQSYAGFMDFWLGKKDYSANNEFVLIQEYITPANGQTARLALTGISNTTGGPRPQVGVSGTVFYGSYKQGKTMHFKDKGPDLSAFISTPIHNSPAHAAYNALPGKHLIAEKNIDDAELTIIHHNVLYGNKQSLLFDFLRYPTLKTFLEENRPPKGKNVALDDYLASKSITELDLENSFFCWSCMKPGNKSALSHCSKCKVAFYCNSECQRKDWKPHHKHECTLLQKK